jgi:hypothetical protein
MNVVRSFYQTFSVFPYYMWMDMYVSPVTTRKVRLAMTLGSVALCSLIYYSTDNPLLAMSLTFLFPEFLLRLILALAVH